MRTTINIKIKENKDKNITWINFCQRFNDVNYNVVYFHLFAEISAYWIGHSKIVSIVVPIQSKIIENVPFDVFFPSLSERVCKMMNILFNNISSKLILNWIDAVKLILKSRDFHSMSHCLLGPNIVHNFRLILWKCNLYTSECILEIEKLGKLSNFQINGEYVSIFFINQAM